MHRTRLPAAVLVTGLLAMAALATGCAQSKVPTDAQVTLTGQITRPDGAPAGNLRLALTRVPDLGELAFQGIPVAVTLGTACLADNPPPLCKLLQQATTDGQGTFAIHMNGSDVQGSFGTATTFDLAAQLPRSGSEVDGPSVRAGFEIQRTDVTVPTLRFWHPDHVTVGGDARTTTLDWAPITDVNDYTAHFSVNGQEIWSDQAAATMDSRAFEDANGVVHISAAASADGPDTTFKLFYTSQGVGFRGRAGAPESRGKPCVAEQQPCQLTDGSFDHPLPESAWAYVDLGGPQPVGTVFARANQAGSLTVETSDDARNWTTRATGDGQFAKITLPVGITARYVRVHGAAGSRITGLTQLSVWP
ncbi:discoidin domain-containing protein [Kutzneria sp. CA-103260]|uniref:discoidin domain-containing protein n=1 Tax=Kutzneria sp. CA-103260 TaxID=2802641 RepID=UPI001BA90E8D|nr:discoidin domain-containing protein [Kutzneria sp. CA-103260]